MKKNSVLPIRSTCDSSAISNNHTNWCHIHWLLPQIIILLIFTHGAVIASSIPNRSAVPLDCSTAGKIIILENGRKKPLDTYARNKLMQYSGKRHIKRLSALSWMTAALFYPQLVDHEKIFLLNNPEIAITLGLTPERRRRYSYAALSTAASKIQQYYDQAVKTTHKNRTVFDNEIIRLYNNLVDYQTLASTISFSNPDIGFYLPSIDSLVKIPDALSNPQSPPSYLDMMQYNDFLSTQMKRIQQKKKTGDSLKEIDQHIIGVTHKMYSVHSSVDNPPPHIIPTTDRGKEVWRSPWGYISNRKSNAINNRIIPAVLACSRALHSNNQTRFDSACIALVNAQKNVHPSYGIPDASLELLYNRLNAFFISKIILGIAAIISLLLLLSSHRMLRLSSGILIGVSLLLSTTGIVLRMLIMHHPPVTNLYETFIFVAWTTIIIGLILEYIGIRSIGFLTASLTGFIFFHIAGRYAADGDTLGMLAAVLDSGFWLTTHIITIALGYAGCLGAAVIAHLYLIQRTTVPEKTQSITLSAKAVYGVLAFGFLFTTVGTVTGGMWADQAWGRFWGWDPKENGALLIILWCAIVFHFRCSGRIKDTGMSVGAIISSILVMTAWIGVNLLGTGLHSYGFTSSGARLLIGYAGLEILFLIVISTSMYIKRSGKRPR